MAAGSISGAEFENAVSEFLKMSNEIGDTWQLVDTKITDNEHYLLKKTVIKQEKSRKNVNKTNFPDVNLDLQFTGEEDCSALSPPDVEEFLTFEYHILYSLSYRVPVLYFNASKPDGRLVSLDELWESIPSQYQERLQHERWTFLTQQEHPILQRPFYQLHPCHTATMMEQARVNKKRASGRALAQSVQSPEGADRKASCSRSEDPPNQ